MTEKKVSFGDNLSGILSAPHLRKAEKTSNQNWWQQ
jgi:hypothetical protein